MRIERDPDLRLCFSADRRDLAAFPARCRLRSVREYENTKRLANRGSSSRHDRAANATGIKRQRRRQRASRGPTRRCSLPAMISLSAMSLRTSAEWRRRRGRWPNPSWRTGPGYNVDHQLLILNHLAASLQESSGHISCKERTGSGRARRELKNGRRAAWKQWDGIMFETSIWWEKMSIIDFAVGPSRCQPIYELRERALEFHAPVSQNAAPAHFGGRVTK